MTANGKLLRDWAGRQQYRWLTLSVAGEIFGGRVGEAPLTLVDASFDGITAELTFSDGECLSIRDPSAFLTADGNLRVLSAADVRFSWPDADRANESQNWSELRYALVDSDVTVSAAGRAAGWRSDSRFPLGRQPMVRLS